MSAVTTDITINLTEAQAALVKADKVLSTGLGGGLAMACEQVVKTHLVKHYTKKPNKLGGTTTNYWQRVHDSASSETTQSGKTYSTTVTLTGVGLRMKSTGGIIRPTGRTSTVTKKPIRHLTIPKHAEAHGKTVSDFDGELFRKGGGLFRKVDDVLMFILTKSAKIKPDPNILPPASDVIKEMTESIHAALA